MERNQSSVVAGARASEKCVTHLEEKSSMNEWMHRDCEVELNIKSKLAMFVSFYS